MQLISVLLILIIDSLTLLRLPNLLLTLVLFLIRILARITSRCFGCLCRLCGNNSLCLRLLHIH